MDKELSEKVNLILEKYEEELKEKGIKCTLSKREHKIPVINFFHSYDIVLHKFTEKREEKLYKNKPNRYSLLILTFSPLDKNLKVKSPKSYAFITKSVDRVAKGFAPQEKVYKEEKILKSIEKCIVKFLNKTENQAPEKICESAFSDNLRYLIFEKYSYQKTVFGKDRNGLELSVLLIFALVAVLLAAVIFLT